MPHINIKSRKPKVSPLVPLAATLLTASLGLAACGSGGSSSTATARTTANAAASTTATTGRVSGAAASGTAASGATASGTPSTPAPPPRRPYAGRFTALRACLAKKGITLPPRTPGAGGILGGANPRLPKGVTRAQFAEALKSCSRGRFTSNHFSRSPRAFNSPAFHQALARFAACLRQNGVNVGEPNTTGRGPVFDTKGINTGSPQFKAAETKCRSTLFAGLQPKARPGAAGGGATG